MTPMTLFPWELLEMPRVSMVGSAVAVEIFFSGGRDTISLWKASLQPETIRTLMLVKQHLHLTRHAIDNECQGTSKSTQNCILAHIGSRSQYIVPHMLLYDCNTAILDTILYCWRWIDQGIQYRLWYGSDRKPAVLHTAVTVYGTVGSPSLAIWFQLAETPSEYCILVVFTFYCGGNSTNSKKRFKKN